MTITDMYFCNYKFVDVFIIYRELWKRSILLGDWLIRNCLVHECMRLYRYCIIILVMVILLIVTILWPQSFDVEFIVSPVNTVIEMICLGKVVRVCLYQQPCVCVCCLLYRESDGGADKKELVVIYEVSNH